jgi:hypothetical protein
VTIGLGTIAYGDEARLSAFWLMASTDKKPVEADDLH